MKRPDGLGRPSRARSGSGASGLVAAALMPGALISILDPARQGAEESFSPVGYQRVAILFALVSLASFQWFVWTVRERPSEPRTTHVGHVYKEFFGALKVPRFQLYLLIFFLFFGFIKRLFFCAFL